jgi:hypothetical protein
VKHKILLLLVAVFASLTFTVGASAPASAAVCTFGSADGGVEIRALCSSGSGNRYYILLECRDGRYVTGDPRRYGTGVPSVARCSYGTPLSFQVRTAWVWS